jgi:hypothetical protein
MATEIMPLAEAQTQLTAVLDAISKLSQGKRLNEFRTGSGNFVRYYSYGEVTLDALKDYRDELISIIHNYENSTPIFRSGSSFKITHQK